MRNGSQPGLRARGMCGCRLPGAVWFSEDDGGLSESELCGGSFLRQLEWGLDCDVRWGGGTRAPWQHQCGALPGQLSMADGGRCVWLYGRACKWKGLVTELCVCELLGLCVWGVICVHVSVSLYFYKS